VHVRHGVVIGEHGPHLAGVHGQVASRGAQVTRRGERCVIDVERVGPPVLIAVRGPDRPCRRDELHRADSVVEPAITVQTAVVGVADERGTRAVQRWADHRDRGEPVTEQLRSGELTMIGLDPADAGQQRPLEIAGRICAIDLVGRPPICSERYRGDSVRADRADHDGAFRTGAGSSWVQRPLRRLLRGEPTARVDRRRRQRGPDVCRCWRRRGDIDSRRCRRCGRFGMRCLTRRWGVRSRGGADDKCTRDCGCNCRCRAESSAPVRSVAIEHARARDRVFRHRRLGDAGTSP
jgi:hypothetical protein